MKNTGVKNEKHKCTEIIHLCELYCQITLLFTFIKITLQNLLLF